MTGTTGHVGGGAIAQLASAGHDLCQIVRDPARAPAIDGVETVVATGLDDGDTLRFGRRGGALAECQAMVDACMSDYDLDGWTRGPWV